MRTTWIIIGIGLWLLSCKSELLETVDPSIYGYEYYPLEVGKQWIYEVDSIQFDIGNNNLPVSDSVRFYIKEEIKELLKDQLGQDLYRIERYRSQNPDGPWANLDVVTASKSTNQAFRTENNLRIINLVFPLEDRIRWDGLAYVAEDVIIFVKGEKLELFKGWEFQVSDFAASENIGSVAYQDIVTVQQADEDSVIELRYSIEKYAKGIGLVYRERRILDSYCKYIGETTPCQDKTWREKAGRGYITKEILIDYR
jgi:hypothetical protein